jgi:hypothetical protein
MKRSIFCSILIAAFAIFFSPSAFAQDGRLSEKKFADWLASSPKNQEVASSPVFISAVAVVSRYETVGVHLDLSIFAGEAFVSMPPVEISVQPMKTVQGVDGKKETVPVGFKTRLRSSGSAKINRGPNGLVAQPQIIANTPEDADAVQVVVYGLTEKSSEVPILMPIRKAPSISFVVFRLF